MRSLLFIAVLLSVLASFSQNLDSLERTLGQVNAKRKAIAALKKSDSLRRVDPTLSYCYALIAKDLQASNDSIVSSANFAISSFYIGRGKYDSALVFLRETKLLVEQSQDSLLLAKALLQTGVVNYYQSDYEGAIKQLLTSSEILEALQDTIMLASVYNNLGSFYQSRDNSYDKALEYYTKAYYRKLMNGDSISANRTLTNIGGVLTATNQVDSGISVLRKTLRIKEQVGDLTGIAITSSNIGSGFIEIGAYDSAIIYLDKAITLDLQLGDSTGLRYDYLWMATALSKSGQYRKSQRFVTDALEITDDLLIRPQLFFLQSEIHEERKDYRDALAAYKEFKTLSDSLYSMEKEKTIQELQTRYETEKKEKEISILSAENKLAQTQLAKRRQLELLLTIILVISIAASVIIYFTLRQKSRLKEDALQSEINQLRAEIQAQVIIDNQSFDKPLEELNQELANPLSGREYDVLQSIFTEKTNREIAEDLFLSVNTVKHHLKNLYVKLGVSGRQEALRRVVDL